MSAQMLFTIQTHLLGAFLGWALGILQWTCPKPHCGPPLCSLPVLPTTSILWDFSCHTVSHVTNLGTSFSWRYTSSLECSLKKKIDVSNFKMFLEFTAVTRGRAARGSSCLSWSVTKVLCRRHPTVVLPSLIYSPDSSSFYFHFGGGGIKKAV